MSDALTGHFASGDDLPKSTSGIPCFAALNIAGEHHRCENTTTVPHSIHSNQAAQAIWSSHDEVVGLADRTPDV